jgi:hypothetical protein
VATIGAELACGIGLGALQRGRLGGRTFGSPLPESLAYQLAPELVEGVHSSLLFYGGALLRHLSPEHPAVEDTISLPRVNRNFWVVIDSDLESEGQTLNATKVRVRDALAAYQGRGASWATAGYMVENYVPPEILQAAVEQVHPASEPKWAGERYLNPLASGQLAGRRILADKAAVAQAAMELWQRVPEWPLDLREESRSSPR